MLVKTDIPKLLLAGMKKEFLKAYEEEPVPDYDKIVTVIKSTKDKETYPWLGAVAKMREWKDERITKAFSEYKFTVTNRSFEGTISVDRDAIEDEQYGQIMVRVRQLAQEAKRYWRELVFDLLGQGNSTSGSGNFDGVDIGCYDTKAFFATDHASGLATGQDNIGSAALDYSNLQTAITSMRKFKDDQGKFMNVQPDTLVVNPDEQFTAQEILNSQFYPETTAGSGAKLAVNVLKGALNLIVTPYIDSGTWVVLDTKGVVKPIIQQVRRNIEFTALTTGAEAFMRKKLLFGVDMRGEVAFGMWQYAFGSHNGW